MTFSNPTPNNYVITPKALTVTGITAASTVYNGTTVATLGGTAAFQAAEAAGTGTTSDGKPYSVDSVSAGGTAAGTLAARNVGSEAVTITGSHGDGHRQRKLHGDAANRLDADRHGQGPHGDGHYGGKHDLRRDDAAKLGGTAAFLATEAGGAGTTADGKPYSVDSVSAGGSAAGTLAARNVGSEAVTTPESR